MIQYAMPNFNFRSWLFPAAVFLFIILLWGGIHQAYHQDEYRWVEMVLKIHDNPVDQPPLTPFLYGIVIKLFGVDWMRLLPAFFGLLNIGLVYKLGGRWAAGLYAVCSYALIASLQIDIDGAVLPFFVLASVYCYTRFRAGDRHWLWLLALAITGGFLTKLSFVLCVGALAIDYALTLRWRSVLAWFLGGSMLAALALVILGKSNPQIVTHAHDLAHFHFASRHYLDLGYKVLKSLVLLSPLVCLPMLGGVFSKNIRTRYRVWYIFVALNLGFYLVVFDFSTLPIERYFMFLIAPGAIIAGDFLKQHVVSWRPLFFASLIAGLVTVIALALPHTILPQYPKIAFVQAITSLRFDFLIPITGGSGPAGLYVAARLILWLWLLCIASFTLGTWSPKYRSFFLALFIALGVLSNAVITQEYLVGGLYGNVSKLVRETVSYVNTDPAIHHVVTYYDIGSYYLQESGKYENRFYVAPSRDYSKTIEKFRGHYMIVDFPKIAEDDRYLEGIRRCPVVKSFTEKEISSSVYDCTKLPL